MFIVFKKLPAQNCSTSHNRHVCYKSSFLLFLKVIKINFKNGYFKQRYEVDFYLSTMYFKFQER